MRSGTASGQNTTSAPSNRSKSPWVSANSSASHLPQLRQKQRGRTDTHTYSLHYIRAWICGRSNTMKSPIAEVGRRGYTYTSTYNQKKSRRTQTSPKNDHSYAALLSIGAWRHLVITYENYHATAGMCSFTMLTKVLKLLDPNPDKIAPKNLTVNCPKVYSS